MGVGASFISSPSKLNTSLYTARLARVTAVNKAWILRWNADRFSGLKVRLHDLASHHIPEYPVPYLVLIVVFNISEPRPRRA